MSDERQIIELLARYVRGLDRRDGSAVAALFTADATSANTVKDPRGGEPSPMGPTLEGSALIEMAVSEWMIPLPAGTSSHHTTFDHIVTVDGDGAHLSAQFIVFETVAAEEPAGGWAPGARGPQGTVSATESGYYDFDVVRTPDGWRFTRQTGVADMPYAIG
jgi:hypothetical protein